MKYHLTAAAILLASALSIGGQVAYGQSLPDTCANIESRIGLLFIDEILEVNELYPDETAYDVSVWLGEATVLKNVGNLPEDLQARVLNKRPQFMALLDEALNAGCPF